MNVNKKSLICLAGKNEIAVYGLNLLLDKVEKKNIRVVYNHQDDPAPGFDTWQPSMLKVAKENDVKVISIDEFYSLDNIIFLSLEFYKIIVPSRFSNSDLFNIHFSNLPCYKGMYTSALPILNNESFAGVTLHEIDAGIDTGDIIDQIKFPIEKNDTVRDLYFKYLSNSKKLLKNNLTNILKGSTKSVPQSPESSSYYSAKTIDYKNLKIKLFSTAEQIRNQIRAYFFPEYQVPKIHGYFVKSAIIDSKKSTNKPGDLLSVNKTTIIIATIDYDLIIYRDKNSEFFEAIKNNDTKSVLEILKYGIDLSIRKGRKGCTPIITASLNGCIAVIKILIDRGFDINNANYKGATPLMYAMNLFEKTGNDFLFHFLLQNGAKPELRDVYGKNIFDYIKEKKIVGLL